MNQIDFLREQIVESRNFVNRLIFELPKDLWYAIPENTDSNFAWQIGHLLISQNFHAITCITGRNDKVSTHVSIADYVKIFNGMGTQHRSVGLRVHRVSVFYQIRVKNHPNRRSVFPAERSGSAGLCVFLNPRGYSATQRTL